jgi:hypothetical protein
VPWVLRLISRPTAPGIERYQEASIVSITRGFWVFSIEASCSVFTVVTPGAVVGVLPSKFSSRTVSGATPKSASGSRWSRLPAAFKASWMLRKRFRWVSEYESSGECARHVQNGKRAFNSAANRFAVSTSPVRK